METTLNPKADYEARHTAALKLRAPDRLKLQRLLLQRIPGDWDYQTYMSLELIKLVGDKSCLPKVEAIRKLVYDNNIELNGQLNYTIQKCIETLEAKRS